VHAQRRVLLRADCVLLWCCGVVTGTILQLHHAVVITVADIAAAS